MDTAIDVGAHTGTWERIYGAAKALIKSAFIGVTVVIGWLITEALKSREDSRYSSAGILFDMVALEYVIINKPILPPKFGSQKLCYGPILMDIQPLGYVGFCKILTEQVVCARPCYFSTPEV